LFSGYAARNSHGRLTVDGETNHTEKHGGELCGAFFWQNAADQDLSANGGPDFENGPGLRPILR